MPCADDGARCRSCDRVDLPDVVDAIHRFDSARLVAAVFWLDAKGAFLGKNGTGRITKCRDTMVRAMLYEVANEMMTRCRPDNNWLDTWALWVAKRSEKGKKSLLL